MAKSPTKLFRDDQYTSRAAAYQLLQIDILNESLKESGISDLQVRRKICESFLFNSGVLLDQY